MNIIAIDDEQSALNILEKAIRKALPGCVLACFHTAASALEYAKKIKPDVAFLDITMPGMSGLIFAKHLKEIHGETNIIFVTGYSQYAIDAFSLRASAYIMKPATVEQVRHEIENLRYPLELPDEGVRIKCFGNFSVFIDGELLVFPNSKAKEMLAILVHSNGDDLSNADLASVLWEDKPYNNSLQVHTRRVRSQLLKTLKSAGVEYIIRKGFNSTAIDTNKITCDYYEFIKGNTAALNSYTGEYMNEYSWAEFTIGYLNSKMK